MIDPAVIRSSALAGGGRYPYAAWMPIPEAATQGPITPRLLVLHSQAGPALTSLESLWKYVARDDIHIEPTFILDLDGRMAQLVDVFTKADCQYKANGFATSVETQDRGAATLYTTPWSTQQVQQLAGLAAWMHLHPRIRLPLLPAAKWDGTGVGPHRQFPEWSVYAGKTCPGDARVAQIPQILTLATQIANTYPSTPIPPTDEDDMALHVYYTGPATADGAVRPELLAVQGKLVGFASPQDRDAALAATDADRWPIANPAQYDEVVRAFRA